MKITRRPSAFTLIELLVVINPTFGFSQNVMLAAIQKSASFLILTDAARADKLVGRGSLTP